MSLSQRILFRWLGFREEVTIPLPGKYILALAPHTSNWDFVLGRLYSNAVGLKCNFLMKKEWFFWPLGVLMRRMGGVPVYRSRQMGSTDLLAKKAIEADEFRLCITPEGTRKPNREWKRGFYYIALKANIPIVLYGLDYERRLIKCTKMVVPTGDIEKDMQEIKEYFREFKGRHPEKFEY
ncbi:MAG: 1-acyl-sn-glycerol-3-phosphate acyltransferase [Bacteroidaceae bacterium]|jgi:1-acyl-sn-glycerol-3-phosphate acyltransferase|nr:1-acyl-sn-glycerol-3-phosphate acyltransferase [Bacteroidaceae bacterium]MBO7347772.1 1-acyl-sn-glycerol-3-phosphate acyltransferase [Bacteroidaceae bacterium]